MKDIIKSDLKITGIICSIIPVAVWLIYFINPLHATEKQLGFLLPIYIVLTILFAILPYIRYKIILQKTVM